MKYIKKLFLLLIPFSLIINMICFSAESERNGSETDISRIQKLQALGLWCDNLSSVEVTRGEFAQLMAAMLGLEQKQMVSTAWKNTFDDVDTKHKSYAAVSFLADRGVIAGNGKKFYPNQPIAYYEAVKMLVCTLGYDAPALENGGYPSGYLLTAKQFHLIRKIESGDAQALSASFCAEMIEYAMDAKLMEPSYDRPSVGQKVQDVTALERYHSIGSYKGILETAGCLSLKANSDYSDDVVMVDEEEFRGESNKFRDYIGYRVKVYYRTGNNGVDRELLYAEPVHGSNKCVEIAEEQLLGYENGYILYENTSGKTAKISADLSKLRVLFNGAAAIPTEEEIRTADRIVFIDNGTGGNSVMKIENLKIFVADSFDHTERTVIDRFRQGEDHKFTIGMNDGNKRITMYDHLGVPTDFYAVKKNSVLRVGASKDGKHVSVILTNVRKEGILKKIDSNGKKLVLDDTEYTLALKSEASEQLKKAEIGRKYTLYLDDRFYVAGLERTNVVEEKYGYMTDAVSADVFQSTARVRLLTADNKFEVFEFASRTQVDGETLKNGTQIVSALSNEQGKVERQPVRYRLNDAGKIVYLDTAKLGTKEQSNGTFYGNPTMTKYESFIGGRFIGDPPMFGAETYYAEDNTQYNVRMTAKTPVFCVPPLNATEEQIKDEKNYCVSNIRIFKNYSTYKENTVTGERVDAYDLNENRTAGLLVYYTRKTTAEPITDKTPVTVVQEVISGLDSEGNPQSYLNGFQAGNYISVPIQEGFETLTKEYYTEDGTVTSTVRFGDVIRFSLDSQGRIDDYEKVFSLTDEDNPQYVKWGNEVNSVNTAQSNPSLLAWSEGYTQNGYCTPFIYKAKEVFEAEYRVVFGTLKERVGNNIVLSVGGEKPMTIVGDIQRYNVLVVDEERQEMYMPDLNEFQPESAVGAENAAQILMHTSKGSSRTVVLVKRVRR